MALILVDGQWQLAQFQGDDYVQFWALGQSRSGRILCSSELNSYGIQGSDGKAYSVHALNIDRLYQHCEHCGCYGETVIMAAIAAGLEHLPDLHCCQISLPEKLSA
jgi:hypothetical protein